MNYLTDNTRIVEKFDLITPNEVLEKYPLTDEVAALVYGTRNEISQILHGKDDRLLVICGPCSVHDKKSAIEYAKFLKDSRDQFSDNLLIVMRVYFEKPRTTVGWKGLINDPMLDGSFKVNEGIRIGRKLLLDIVNLGIPAGTEYLDLISPQYIADIISWGAIGARTTESQVHRQLVSGLSMPIGFKNGTDGSLSVAINAIKSSRESHHFLGLNEGGRVTVYETKGNKYTHVVLRGGAKPNYDKRSLGLCEKNLKKENLPSRIMIDCSHGNTNKDYTLQPKVAKYCINQVLNGNDSKNDFIKELRSQLTKGWAEF